MLDFESNSDGKFVHLDRRFESDKASRSERLATIRRAGAASPMQDTPPVPLCTPSRPPIRQA